MLNAIAGVFPIDKGSIVIDGEDITKKPEHKRAKYIGRVFQDPMLGTAAGMQIEENLSIAARRGERPGFAWSLPEEQHNRFYELLKELDLGLENRMTAKVGLLSGGQRQALTLLMATLKSLSCCFWTSILLLLILKLQPRYWTLLRKLLLVII